MGNTGKTMKSLQDSLKRLFGTDPESTPAVPVSLREAVAAESASPVYDYPLVSSIDDLPPDPDSSRSTTRPDGDSIPAAQSTDDSESGRYQAAADDSSVVCEPPVEYPAKPAERDGAPQRTTTGTGARYQVSGGHSMACCHESADDNLLSDLKACDPRAFSKRLQQGVREVHAGNPVAFYTAAGISRSAYSRLISHPDRHPAKDTVLSMAAALRMSLPEADSFLRLAGYALSPHIPADRVWRHCFLKNIHDLSDIRRLLAEASLARR